MNSEGMHKGSISIVIPTMDREKQLIRLLRSLSLGQDFIHEIIVVDNSENDVLTQKLKEFGNLTLIHVGYNSYSNGARRIGAQHATGEYIFFLDDDNVIDADTLPLLLDAIENDPKIAVVAPVSCFYANKDRVWSAGGVITSFGLANYYGHKFSRNMLVESKTPELDFFPNAFMIRNSIVKELGIDDANFPHNWAEPDTCLRIKRSGYKLALSEKAAVWHDIDYAGGTTRLGVGKTYDQARSRITFRKIHLNTFHNWLKFVLVVLPISSVVYLVAISKQQGVPAKVLVLEYFKGTWDGFVNKPKIAGRAHGKS